MRRILRVTVVLACSAFLSAAGSSACQSASGGIYVAPEMKIGTSRTVDMALQEAFPNPYEVTVGEGASGVHKTVKNCSDYLALGRGSFTTGSTVDDASLHYAGANCDALALIKRAKVAKHPAFTHFAWRGVTVRQLPPELALSISRDDEEKLKEVSARGGSILEMDPGLRLRVRSANMAQLVAEDWTAALTVQAHADFLGDGNEELLVRWVAKATGGSLGSTNVFLLGRSGDRLAVVTRRP